MNNSYKELLKDKRWVSLRLSIMKRDLFKCVKCNDTQTLQVHHIKYISGKKPWEVPNYFLQTLCKECHEKAHLNKDISSFFISEKDFNKSTQPKEFKKQQQKKISKIERRLNRLKMSMSKKDKLLQDKYDSVIRKE